jgi:aromatic ring-opening dioxygenase LigB subunit
MMGTVGSDNVVFACIAPHGWLLIPLVSGPDGAKTRASRAALEEMGRRMAAARPETVAILEPHGLLVDGAISLLDNSRVEGRTGGPADLGATAHGYSMKFDVDRGLNAAIAAAARAADVPVARARNFLDFVPPHIDFGSMNPLWYLGATFSPPPKLVTACVGPGVTRAVRRLRPGGARGRGPNSGCSAPPTSRFLDRPARGAVPAGKFDKCR